MSKHNFSYESLSCKSNYESVIWSNNDFVSKGNKNNNKSLISLCHTRGMKSESSNNLRTKKENI